MCWAKVPWTEEEGLAVKTWPGRAPAARERSFEGFYRRERPGLYRALALTLGDADLAAEAVDEAMTRAYQRWGRVCDYDNPAGWIYRVGLNWAISRKRRKRALPLAEVRSDVGRSDPPPGDEVLAAAVQSLPEPQRAVVVLRYHLDWSTEQVASALRVPQGTVKSRLHRGLAALREILEASHER